MNDLLCYIRAHCELCGWNGVLPELLDYDENSFEGYKAEYCPACQSPYVIYDEFTISFGEDNEQMAYD
jgi:hypothetical protein